VTDLERFFAQLVRTIAAGDRARLGKPLLLVEIRNSILPYRAHRRALQLESSEDYELVLLRLCAGEGGFARTGPDEVRDQFVKELGSPIPDLTIIQQHEDAVVHLDPRAVARALDPQPHLAYAPTEPQVPRPKSSSRKTPKCGSPAAQVPGKASRCSRCGGHLPAGRTVNFCPQCGQNLAQARCAECESELEEGWRHCVSCGASVA
jgi:double zinc ribbon protein